MRKWILFLINILISVLIFAEVDKTDTDAESDNKEPSKIVKIINKIDKKVNPEIKFYVPSSYGKWYVIYSTSSLEKEKTNFYYDFKKESLGYKIETSYYDEKSKKWISSKVRSWIEEEKGEVYLRQHKKYFLSSKNKILFFDGLNLEDGTQLEYSHMIIRFEENDGSFTTRVLSRNKDEEIEKVIMSDELQKIIDSTEFYKIKQM